MATTVTAGVGGANGTIKFEFTVASILEEVESATSNIESKLESESETLDKFTLTSDELFHFTKFLKEAHKHVSKLVDKMTNGIATPFVLDETKVSYTIVDKLAHNSAVLPVFDKMLFNVICSFIIREWFIQCGLKEYAELYGAQFNNESKLAVKYSINLRRGNIA